MAEARCLSETMRAALRTLWQSKRWPAYIHGTVGTGKSCAAAVVYRMWPANQSAQFWTLPELVAKIVQARANGSSIVQIDGLSYERTEEMWWRIISQQSLLVVDDVGIRHPSDSGFEIVYTLANLRAKKPTIYTSNLEPKALAAVYDDRIADRMLSGTVIRTHGKSQRTKDTQTLNG